MALSTDHQATDHAHVAQALNGLRVLVTRPERQAGKWQQRLQMAGAQTLRVPLMAIEPLTDAAGQQAIKQRIMGLSDYQHVIFVSQNAAHYGLEWIDQYWPQLPVGVNFYTVGSATGAVVQRYLDHHAGTVIAADASMNSEALLALPQLQQVELIPSANKVLIMRGQGGRPMLAQVLAERGALVDYCELYQRAFDVSDALAHLRKAKYGEVENSEPASSEAQGTQDRQATQNTQDTIIVALHSGEALHNWHTALLQLRQIEPALWQYYKQLPLLLPGERVAAQAADLGFEALIVATNASDQVMLQALQSWYHRTHS